MNDYLGKPLKEGDHVLFLPTGYRDFRKGRVDSFTTQKVRVAYPSPFKGGGTEITRRYPTELIRYE